MTNRTARALDPADVSTRPDVLRHMTLAAEPEPEPEPELGPEPLHAPRSCSSSSSWRVRIFPVVLSVAVGLAGCGDDDSVGGVSSADRPGPDQAAPGAPAWEVREVVRLGAVDGPPEMSFGRVAALEVDPEGRVYVLDAQVPIVRVFDGEGAYVGDLGGPGEGPGEFQRPGGLLLDEGGRLWVVDWGLMRYTAFDVEAVPEGGGATGSDVPAATYRREFSAGFGGPWNVASDEDGRIYEPTTIWGPSGELERVIFALATADGRMVPMDTLALGPAPERPEWPVHQVSTQGGVVIAGGLVPVPFVPRERFLPSPGGGVWAGRTDRPRFVKRSIAGDTLEVRDREAAPRPVTRAAIDAVMSELRHRFDDSVDADLADIPDRLPHWEDFVVDDRGRLWVERFRVPGEGSGSEAEGEWEVYGEDGEFLGAVRLPIRSTPAPRFFGGRIIGVTQDELGVPFVVVLEVGEG